MTRKIPGKDNNTSPSDSLNFRELVTNSGNKRNFRLSKVNLKLIGNQVAQVPNPGLKSYFMRTRSGNPLDYRTPFAGGIDRALVLDAWEKVMCDIVDSGNTYSGSLIAFERDMRKKVGPLSVQQPLQERIPKIIEYWDAVHSDSVHGNVNMIDPSAIEDTIKWISKIGSIHPISWRETANKMRLSTNSGLPYFAKRKLVVDKTLRGMWRAPSGSGFLDWKPVAVLGWRGQEGGPQDTDVKQRVVFMFPLHINILELSTYQPLIEAVQKHNLIPAYISIDEVDKEITALFATKGKDDLVICTDFTAFDQHFGLPMQNAAKTVLEAVLDHTVESHSWLRSVFHVKYNIPLMIDYGVMIEGWHGMGSGSGGTNFDECIAHKALQFEAARNAGAELNPHSMAYGDDGILTYPGITPEQVTKVYTKHGLEMNLSKQLASDKECIVLRRWHHVDYRVSDIMVGVYSTIRALNRLMSQERFYDPEIWSREMVCLRYLSIIENCKWHPAFKHFVKFCMKRDKYRLGLDIPGFLDDIADIASKAADVMPDFLGFTKGQQSHDQGIDQWAVVKLLKSMREER